MNILTQFVTPEYLNINSFDLLKMFSAVRNPTNGLHTIMNYANITEGLSKFINRIAIDTLLHMINEIDETFRKAPGRTSRYHIKAHLERTLITVYGTLTFKRIQYENLDDKSMYYHVDSVLGFLKYDHYDPLVKSMMVELFSSQNSMIKVGEIIGDRIYSHYSLDSDRNKFIISRQTVYNTLKKAKQLVFEAPLAPKTPETLYIMADEKFIPLQGEGKPNGKPVKMMVKLASVFEDCVTKGSRNQLINKFSFATTTQNFWNQAWEMLNQRYDLEQVKRINILGDGAGWIKAGAQDLKTDKIITIFALDKFHFMQAINRISHDELYKEILTYYVINNMKEYFIVMVDIIMKENPHRVITITTNYEYILNHWTAIQNTYHKIKMGCSMESEISHTLASVFTSVPKAYARNNISTYVNYRLNCINGIDLRKSYLQSLSMKSDDNTVYFKESFDFSMFEPRVQKYEKSATSNFIKSVISRH